MGDNPGSGYHRDVNTIVTAIGADPDATMYALRHSSIARMLLQNVPIRLVASLHNTSVAMIERTYSKYITEHSDGVSRGSLLVRSSPSGVRGPVHAKLRSPEPADGHAKSLDHRIAGRLACLPPRHRRP